MRFMVKGRVVRSLRRCPLPASSSPLLSIPFQQSSSGSLPVLSKRRLPPRTPLWAWALFNGIEKTSSDGRVAHMTSINCNTGVKSIVRLSTPPKQIKNAHVTKLSQLPGQAMEALGAIILDCKKPPKILQKEADDLSNKLEMRHFPANPKQVQMARKQIMHEMFEEDPALLYQWEDTKQRPTLSRMFDKEAHKRLAATRYNWKPLKFDTKEAAVVYALSRFGGYFAEMRRVFSEFDRNGFEPETVLDYGSGSGAAFWAAFERWGNKVREYSLMDQDYVIRQLSMDLLRGKNYTGSGEMITQNVFFRKDLFPSPQHTYDLVILHRTLIEIQSEEKRMELIEKLWKRTKRFLVVVDSHMPDAFEALIQIRDFILIAGNDFDADKTKELLRQHGKLDQYTIELFASNKVETYEKFCIAREKLPDHVPVPTRLEPGHVFAPCPHDQACPLLSNEKSCKFKVRWQEFRTDHRTKSVNRDGTLTGEFSFLIMEKGERKPAEAVPARLLQLERAHKCVSCHICTAFDGLQQLVVSKRHAKVYARIRRAMPSQLLPVNMEVVKSEIDLLRNSETLEEQKRQRMLSISDAAQIESLN
ncbi:hypothetical protein niasHT_009967 [Heterodera trifolii]|uniref:Methyltransferase-like protein 17, mitochondrial n=1 Tax=Heterodera trifolii TaxID=157864 RepID=A0ABD2M8E3_9BILA